MPPEALPTPKSQVIITPVANGFILKTVDPESRFQTPDDATFVFNTPEDLAKHILEHFTPQQTLTPDPTNT